MSNDKQTAVDFLMDKLFDPSMMVDEQVKWFEQAKEIEKQRMIGLLQWMNRVTQSNPMRLETDDDDVVEQYYLETYGSNK
jgi:hypothetical protein